MVGKSENDLQLRTELAGLVQLAKDKGTRSEAVREYVSKRSGISEFVELAACMLLLLED